MLRLSSPLFLANQFLAWFRWRCESASQRLIATLRNAILFGTCWFAHLIGFSIAQTPMPRSEAEIKVMTPFAQAIGAMSIEWNDMCEAFGLLFSRILYPHQPFSRTALAIWHSVINDRTQRDMLKAAAQLRTEEANRTFPRFGKDVEWVLKKANALADHRNNVVHAPLTFELDANLQAKTMKAADFFGHPRAIRLEGIDLVKEYDKMTSYAERLKLFARGIDAAMAFGLAVHPWPNRPQLPSLRLKKTLQDQLRRHKS